MRALRALGALLLGALGAWLVSPEFGQALSSLGPWGVFALALISPAAMFLDKLRRDLRG